MRVPGSVFPLVARGPEGRSGLGLRFLGFLSQHRQEGTVAKEAGEGRLERVWWLAGGQTQDPTSSLGSSHL